MPNDFSNTCAETPDRETNRIPEFLQPLLQEKASLRQLSAGQKIMNPGEGRDRIVCLIAGRAELVTGYQMAQGVIIEHLDPGDIFGDLAFLTGRVWPTAAELVATEPSTVLEISVDRFQRILRENPEFTVSLLKAVGKKVVDGDRSELTALVHVESTDSSAVCAYPSHPGLPGPVQSQFQERAIRYSL
jgi:CRP-like cAMP-binding protein